MTTSGKRGISLNNPFIHAGSIPLGQPSTKNSGIGENFLYHQDIVRGMKKTIDEEIQEAEKALALLKERKAQFDELPPEKRLAIHLHDNLCRTNHTDGCSWHYEIKGGIHIWSGYAHHMYLSDATHLLKISDEETIMFLTKLRNANMGTALKMLKNYRSGTLGFD